VTLISKNSMIHPRTTICGVRFSCFDVEDASSWLFEAARARRGGHICVTGAHGIVLAQNDPELSEILNTAAMNALDGQPVVMVARSRGYRVTRVTGRELVWGVVRQDTASEIRHLLFGATGAVTRRMIDNLRQLRREILVDAFNPSFGPMTDSELDVICEQLASDKPTIVWVGLSTPKQERLARRLAIRFPNSPVVAIGAGFDFVAGLTPEAPRIMTVLCLEWLFRLGMEPRRLSGRYLHIVPRFLALLLRELLSNTSPTTR
jgi:N-acetylglucosaminyldiphosphoundecaprenol N-acetyl-beta-D-mannosaminyltransferase